MGRGQLNKNSGAYLGVTPSTPPNMVVLDRAPTTKDYRNFSLGDLWMDQPNQDLFVLVSKALGAGTWLTLGGQAGNVNDFFTDDGNTVVPNAGTVNVFGSININTAGNIASTINVNLNNSIIWPATTADALAGVISIDGETVFHTYDAVNSPSHNLFVGEAAGNLTLLTAEENVGLGSLSLASLVSGDDNFAGGYASGQFIDSGSRNVLAGSLSGQSITSGSDNVFLGYNAGGSMTVNNQNVFIGTQAGEALDLSSGSVAIGYQALQSLPSGSAKSTCVGYQSLKSQNGGGLTNDAFGADTGVSITTGGRNGLFGRSAGDNLTTGSYNLLLGRNSGTNYTDENSNICINNDGVVTDANTIRIGTEGNADGEQDAVFVAGIYNTTGLTATRNVVIDSTGQLGTGGSDGTPNAFLAIQALANATAIPAGGAPYLLGDATAFTEIYDVGNNFFPGDGLGTPASFTAPSDGKYYLSFRVNVFRTTPAETLRLLQAALKIITTARTYQNISTVSYISGSTSSVSIASHEIGIIADMTAADTATFSVSIDLSFVWGLSGNGAGGEAQTWIQGFQVSS